MIKTKKGILLICLIGITILAQGQSKKKRLQPGKLYEPGAHIYAPKYGVNGIIPEGWEGTLPRDTEIFLLMPLTPIGGEVFTFSNDKKDLSSIKDGWIKGANLSETIVIKSTGGIKTDGDMISAEVMAVGEQINKGYKGFIAAKCSPYGPCITCLGIGPVQFFDQVKTAVNSFMSTTTFTEPSNVSIYADFSWKEFLSGKMLITFMGMEGASESGTKESTFHLCSDGTFKSWIKKKGMMKQLNPSYKGNQSGTWSTESVGDNGTLKLKFNKLPEVEVPLFIKDEKIYVNEERYFAAESDKCK